MVDWVDFVQLSGTQYIAGLDGQVPPVASAQLGAVVGRVRCQLSALKFSETPGPNVDGDAAFLPIGTEVHAIDGVEPSCRVAAPTAHGVAMMVFARGSASETGFPGRWQALLEIMKGGGVLWLQLRHPIR
jgi:hypothetical protein